ncbi:hypothetical protein CAL12_01970 [Bordetella genomosp. 8]|uniref:Uncharacterized protein n=1 Tax=Bordetella genomosp. 8 TaxID=1416806 RepID=A0A1W6YFC2_9BORD|nr:hypothetical protein [Bordetella genomosp. 8]ARP79710.1 hypothetical protein CAL12_01970 [Bordetella genomosp. 8]
MAGIHGTPVPVTLPSQIAQDSPRGQEFTARPNLKRAGTRKRLGAVLQAARDSMMLSFHGIPDQAARKADTNRKALKLSRVIYTLLDTLAAGRDKNLPLPKDALHQLMGIVVTQKLGATLERIAQPFVDAYVNRAPREDVLVIFNRLNELAGAVSLFAAMNETNRQDGQGIIEVLKRACLTALARDSVGASLGMLAGSLDQPQPDPRVIAKAWFSLDHGVREAACKERLPPVEHMQAGLESLSHASTRVLCTVLAPQVPPHARTARYLLETAIHDTLRDVPAEDYADHLDTGLVREAVRTHVVATIERRIAQTIHRLENATRPGIRTAEVANREWHDIRGLLLSLGWVYMAPDYQDGLDEQAQAERATERHYARAVMMVPPRTAAAFLERLDTERLLAMYGHLDLWSGDEHAHLSSLLQRACGARLHELRDAVLVARSALDAAVHQDRRIATAHALLMLSDALAQWERFALGTSAAQDGRQDPGVDAAIRRAAGSLRMPGEPGIAMGQSTLGVLDDAAFADLLRSDHPRVAMALSLDPSARANEARRRLALADAAVAVRLARLSDLLRDPLLAPRSFTSAIVGISLADMARRDIKWAFGGGRAQDATPAASPTDREIGTMLYRDEDAAPLPWAEIRRHVRGLLGALRHVRQAATHGEGGRQGADMDARATVDTAISVLRRLEGHSGLRADDPGAGHPGAVFSDAGDPYWNPRCLADIAPFFGLRYEPAFGMALPLCGSMHRARLLAALGMRMALPPPGGLHTLAAQVQGELRDIAVDKHFHDAAYRRGELSLRVNGHAADPSADPRMAALGDEVRRQSAPSLDRALVKLAGLGNGMDIALTRLMSALSQGLVDFVQSARDMPETWRWSRIPEPEAVRHIHFDISEMAQGGYRLDIVACLETPRPDMEVHLTFTVRANETGGRVTSLIVPPTARLMNSLFHIHTARPIHDAGK